MDAQPEKGVVRELLQVRAPDGQVRMVLHRRARVSGAVTDEQGTPVARAMVKLRKILDSYRHHIANESTDEHGRFSFEGLDPGQFELNATYVSGGVERTSSPQSLVLREREEAEVTLRLEAGWTLSGVAVDQEGQPIPGVRVYVLTSQDIRSWESCEGPRPKEDRPFTQTGPDGRFTLRHLQRGDFQMEADKDGYRFVPSRSTGGQPGIQRLHVRKSDGGVRLVLERFRRIRGRVTGMDGAPITRFFLNGSAVVDPQGAFVRSVGSAGSWKIELDAKGMASVLRTVEVQEGSDVDLGEVRMSPGRRIQGRVLDAETSAPVRGARVFADGSGGRTEEDGTFLLSHAEARPLSLHVEAPGFVSRSIDLGSGSQRDEPRSSCWMTRCEASTSRNSTFPPRARWWCTR
ncbi:carboxypeptidase regulatory-like domain-containing protein [Archangium violaceum]|uniref:carboxypeptidase regulatory-like domain-containing protein n=1 Tax=Archangium violaceum TaxID=83451 RepID=UPI0036D9F1D0